jgi:hypothetical protein
MFVVEDRLAAKHEDKPLPVLLCDWLLTQPRQTSSVRRCASVMKVSEWEIRRWAEDSDELWLENLNGRDDVSADRWSNGERTHEHSDKDSG